MSVLYFIGLCDWGLLKANFNSMFSRVNTFVTLNSKGKRRGNAKKYIAQVIYSLLLFSYPFYYCKIWHSPSSWIPHLV